jgi:iron complex outermembrane receptor protein
VHLKHLGEDLFLRFSKTILTASLVSLLLTEPLAAQEDSHQHEVEEIVITSTRSKRSFAQQPTRVEVLGAEELGEKANMKPGDIRMLLNESTGIYVQQTSATSFNSSIRIQGLDGKYTQLLRDGMPLYGGFSGGLSLLQIAPLDLQQVELIKGSNSTLFGGGAIAGLVNLVSKRPSVEPEASLLVNATSAQGFDASGFFSGTQGDIGATLFTSYNSNEAFDPADNGVSAIPQFERLTFSPRLFVSTDNTEFNFGISGVVENRLGGAIDYINDNRNAGLYFEDSETTRLASQFESVTQLESNREFVVRSSINYFDRDLLVPDFAFAGTQLSSFSEVHVSGQEAAFDWVAGVNLWTEDFDQHSAQGQALDFSSNTFGAFLQATKSVSDQVSVESGLRIDRTADYGAFFLPRVSLLYTPSADTTLRIGGGLGYKDPTLFTEAAETIQFQGILPLSQTNLEAEQSAGLNIDINRAFEFKNNVSLNLNWLVFYTRVDDPLSLLATGDNQYEYRQIDEYLDSQGTEINSVLRWNDLKLFLGYTHVDVEVHGQGEARRSPLVPANRVNSVLVYEKEDDLRIGLEAYYYGSQELNNGLESRDYWIFGLMMEKIFDEDLSVFLNFENFSDTRQSRYENIFSGSLANPVFNDIFAPLDGFVVNGGIKLNL